MIETFRSRLSALVRDRKPARRRRSSHRVELLDDRVLLATVVDLGAFPGTLANATINASQVVAGTDQSTASGTPYQAFVLTSTGTNTTINPLTGYTSNYAAAINDSGDVAGYSQTTTDNGTVTVDAAYLYADGTTTGLGTLGTGDDSVATAHQQVG